MKESPAPTMHIALLSLAFLLAVALSALLSRMLPEALPRPLIQIALGAVAALVSGQQVELDPEVFFLLLVPPLLFFDGWRIPKDRLYEDRHAILGLALGLVFLTVAGIGYFLHWMIPGLPLGVAFAVAAVVSPTDPIAVSSIAERVPVPRRLMNILQGESLLNDASGLVCLRFAVAAVVTGSFSFGEAALSFVWTAAAGVAIGVGLCWAVVRARDWVGTRFGQESWSDVLLTLLIPFAAYLLAEHIEASGILAAAAAGITMTFAAARTADLPAATRMRGRVIWEMLEFTFNGIIFVLLGTQLPHVVAQAPQTAAQASQGGPAVGLLLGYVVALMLGLLVIRFAWAWLALQLTLFREHRRHGRSGGSPPLRIVAAMACAGARGAITLAGVLTLPLVLADGATPFPARDVAIFLAAGVILLSLILASVALPRLLQGIELPSDDPAAVNAERAARIAAAEAALSKIDEIARDLAQRHPGQKDRCVAAARRVAARYRTQIDTFAADPDEPVAESHAQRIEHRLQQAGIDAERATIHSHLKQRRIDSELAHRLLRELDLADVKADQPR